jgi:REP element-mobilizing transposase RayT
MKFDAEKHHRHSIRLRGYDYTQAGAYFVTIVTNDRVCLFSEIVDGEMRLNDGGRMIQQWWFELNRKFSTVETDEFVVMPNHFHGIVVIAGVTVGADLRVGPNSEGAHAGAPLPTIIQWFKTMTTNEYMRGVKTRSWTPFAGRLWQRNYYEHIVRCENELTRIREYIANNPLQWEMDRENPSRTANRSTRKAESWEV